jgi:hypothetical protein
MYQFVHPTKSGGTALDVLFAEHCPGIIKPAMGHSIRCSEADNPVIVIRHPVPRFISMFQYWKSGSERYTRDDIQWNEAHKDVSVKDFIKMIDDNSSDLCEDFTWDQHYYPQSWWFHPLVYKRTYVMINKGSLTEPVNQLFKTVGVPMIPELEHINVSRRSEIVLDDEDLEWVKNRYHGDFLLWSLLHTRQHLFRGIFVSLTGKIGVHL